MYVWIAEFLDRLERIARVAWLSPIDHPQQFREIFAARFALTSLLTLVMLAVMMSLAAILAVT